jgi:hypothetical protein
MLLDPDAELRRYHPTDPSLCDPGMSDQPFSDPGQVDRQNIHSLMDAGLFCNFILRQTLRTFDGQAVDIEVVALRQNIVNQNKKDSRGCHRYRSQAQFKTQQETTEQSAFPFGFFRSTLIFSWFSATQHLLPAKRLLIQAINFD